MKTRQIPRVASAWILLAAFAAALVPGGARAESASFWAGPPSERPGGLAAPARKLIATEGKGYLETVNGYRVLHLKGTPAEMGRQHGSLLKQLVRDNVSFLLRGREGIDPRKVELQGGGIARMAVGTILNSAFQKQVPQQFMDEMKALAEAADLPFNQVLAANLIPEAFHCSGFALLKEATACGQVLHGRVLDYGVTLRLQERAVLIIQEPDGRQPFVNVSYAGFIGSVTGMNAAGVSIGEMGGGGTGRWRGIPMSFLVRMVLEDATTLDQAVGVFTDNPRTCEYYYVIADARANRAVGMKAVPEKVELIQPGQAHPLLPNPVPSAVALSAGKRYQALSRLIRDGRGTFTPESAIRLMDEPVAMKSNLHDALMVPALGVLYVANAGPDGEPAWKQTYHRFDMRELTGQKPE